MRSSWLGALALLVGCALTSGGAGSAVGPSRLLPRCARPSDPRVGLDASGDAVAVWLCLEGRKAVQAAVRPAATGAWSAPRNVVRFSAGDHASHPALAVDAGGDAVAVW